MWSYLCGTYWGLASTEPHGGDCHLPLLPPEKTSCVHGRAHPQSTALPLQLLRTVRCQRGESQVSMKFTGPSGRGETSSSTILGINSNLCSPSVVRSRGTQPSSFVCSLWRQWLGIFLFLLFFCAAFWQPGGELQLRQRRFCAFRIYWSALSRCSDERAT